ncbi:MAG: hypothetical protein ACP5QT_03375 [Brevinematia bacterium]
MALEAEILSKNYQLPQDFTQKLLKFTKDDLEAAIKILEAAEKSVVFLKGKFITNKKIFNGAFIFAYNFELKELSYVFFVVSSDASLSRINIEASWKDFYNELYQYANGNAANLELSHELERIILVPENLRYVTNFFVDSSNIDQVNLKRFLINEIAKIIMDSGLSIKTAVELTDVFAFENFLSQNPLGQKANKKSAKDLLLILNLKVEPVLAPIGGIELGNLEYGDEILLKIKDERDIVQFVLSMVSPESFQAGAIYAMMVYKELDEVTGNYGVRVEFGPGIYGSFLVGSKVRIQARKRSFTTQQKQPPPQKETKTQKTETPPRYTNSEYYEKEDKKEGSFIFEKSPFQTFIAILIMLIFLLIALLFIL